VQEIVDFIQQEKPAWLHLVLTGRDAAPELIAIADTVTEMKIIKHAYAQGIKAEQGIEF
jgi:cob(I)alamin adenosyltransferase